MMQRLTLKRTMLSWILAYLSLVRHVLLCGAMCRDKFWMMCSSAQCGMNAVEWAIHVLTK